VGIRLNYLLGKRRWTPDHQAFHDFYVDRLKYDFKKDWDEEEKPPTLPMSDEWPSLQLVKVPDNCLFHALSHQLTSRFPDRCTTTEYTHALVRALAAEGVGDLGEGFRETFRQETISDERTNPDKKDLTFEECISCLRSGRSRGNFSCLKGVVHNLSEQVFECPLKIVVHRTQGEPSQVKSWEDSASDPPVECTVTLHLGLDEKRHYYSTKASERQGPSQKRNREACRER
jgi:hypothetical protein